MTKSLLDQVRLALGPAKPDIYLAILHQVPKQTVYYLYVVSDHLTLADIYDFFSGSPCACLEVTLQDSFEFLRARTSDNSVLRNIFSADYYFAIANVDGASFDVLQS